MALYDKYSLYDVINPSPPALYDVYDLPNAGPSSSPTPASQAAMGGAQPPTNWMSMLGAMAKQGGGQGAPIVAQPSTPGRPPTAAAPLPGSTAQSKQGLFGNSRKGFDIQSLMSLAALVGTGGAAAGLMGGMGSAGAGVTSGADAVTKFMGGGGAASGGAGAGAGAGGAGGGGGIMSMLGGIGGGGGASKSAGPPMSYPKLPTLPGPLVPQSVAQWQPPGYDPWTMHG